MPQYAKYRIYVGKQRTGWWRDSFTEICEIASTLSAVKGGTWRVECTENKETVAVFENGWQKLGEGQNE